MKNLAETIYIGQAPTTMSHTTCEIDGKHSKYFTPTLSRPNLCCLIVLSVIVSKSVRETSHGNTHILKGLLIKEKKTTSYFNEIGTKSCYEISYRNDNKLELMFMKHYAPNRCLYIKVAKLRTGVGSAEMSHLQNRCLKISG